MSRSFQDIGAVEAAAKEDATRFRAIFEYSVDAIAVYEGDVHAMVNPAYLKLFGYDSPHELVGKPGPDLIAPTERERIKENIRRRMLGQSVPSAYVTRGLRKDGGEFDLEIHANHFDLDGQRFRLVFLRDVSDRLRSEEALRKAHEELESRVIERTADLRRANRYLLAMKQCTETLAKATGESELLNAICGIIAQTGDNRFAWVGFPKHDAEKTVEIVALQGGGEDYLKNVEITWGDGPSGRGPFGKSVRYGKVEVCHNTQTDPDFAFWREAARQHDYHSAACLPLIWETVCLGVLCIYANVPHAFGPEELKLLEQFANDLTFGLVALRTRADRERLQKELLESSENEKCRIGKDLHDGICQQLCGIQLFADVIARSQPAAWQDSAAGRQLEELKDLIHRTMIETRMLSRSLSPVAVESQGLVAGLHDLTATTERLSQTPCLFHCSDAQLSFDKTVEIHLYRIAQEAVSNAIKHARAGSIKVSLTRKGSKAVLEILDDGVGIEPGAMLNGGMGLRTMNYRADVVGGRLEIVPGKGKGTRVVCTLESQSKVSGNS